jgi:hypothetical protein
LKVLKVKIAKEVVEWVNIIKVNMIKFKTLIDVEIAKIKQIKMNIGMMIKQN